ncbi:RHS repeat-associated core domain-containing protein [Colwellia sp. TT2012]|uniref:RHS repeat-associated core domain-containing protein n=1 Tax=Colwellia sp. TT2012 TaxID=1720342 RepID=UPI00070C6347|nr:RHS repeat-associated core domain-containing protein [Colwellia sp. TT2012]
MQARYYDPVIGRFYSNDPVGITNIHTFNRYAYANNNPYKYVDPTGEAAEITYKKNGSIQINIPISYSGSGYTYDNISSIKKSIANVWSGTYLVNGKDTYVNVQITKGNDLGVDNNVELINGPTSDIETQGKSFVQTYTDGTTSGEWRTDKNNLTNGSIGHEAGHLMGAVDQYDKMKWHS